MSLSTSISQLYSKDLTQGHSSLDGQGVNPNWRERQAVPSDGSLDLKFLSALHGILHQATEPTMVIPMVLASPAFHIGKVGTLRGLLGMTAQTWWNRGAAARLLSSSAGFLAETTFFSTSSRGLTHLLRGPVAWDGASMAHDWAAAGMTLGFLKTAGFLGRQVTLAYRNLDEAMPQLWTKTDTRTLWWASQASGYLGLVGSHQLEEQLGFRQAVPRDNLWLGALGTHLALGLGAHAGRTLLGGRFAALEQQLAVQAKLQQREAQSPWGLGRNPAAALAGSGAGPGASFFPVNRVPGRALIQNMSSMNDEGPVPKSGTPQRGSAATEPQAPESEAPQTLRGVRRRMAETMDQSREVPRANINVDADIHRWPEGTHATTRLMQAMVYAIQKVPKLNSWYRHGDKPTLEVKDAVDLGVAVDTPEGLIVVTLRDMAGLSGSEMKAGLKKLQEKIQRNEIRNSDLSGQTIILSNIGSIGGRYADPVVLPPTVAIVAAGRSGDQVVAHEGKPAVHRVLPLSLSFDHRPIDGAEATRFLEAMKADLERPESALIPVPKGETGNGSPAKSGRPDSVVAKVEEGKRGEATAREGQAKAAPGEFQMEFPHIGEGVSKGELVSWLVKEGDGVAYDQDIAEVMTDKATVTIPSPVAGVVKSLKFQEGDMVEVGEIFIVLKTEEAQGTSKKKSGNGSPSNGSGAHHQEFTASSLREAARFEPGEAVVPEPSLAEPAPAPTAASEPIPQSRAEVALAPRSSLPNVELSPLPGKIHTAPQTADRPKAQFEILQDSEGARKLEAFSNSEEVVEFLTERSQLSAQDKIHYTQFVLDRLPPYPELLGSFSLPTGTQRLESALKYFVHYFGDESSNGFRADLRENHLVSKGREAQHPLGHDLLILMRRSRDDAIYLLDRLGQLENAQDPKFSGAAAAKDPNRIQPQQNYDLSRLAEVRQRFPELTEEALRFAYQHAVAQRVLTEKIYRIKAQTGQPPFVVSDAGHEVQGTAAALALQHSVNREAFAISPHYRSGTLVGMWSRLHGSGNFFAQFLRQQLSKITDTWSKGRETASHFRDERYQILPGQSEVGRNLQKGAGYARALQQKGKQDGLVYAEMGDGSMALSDFHEAMVIANTMGFNGGKLPLVLAVMDNQMAISVEPSSGRALEDLQSHAKAYGIHFMTCDGNDFLSVYETYRAAAKYSREQQSPTIIWVQNLPRLNNHSSAAAFEFDFNQKDPLLDFAAGLVQEGILSQSQILRRQDVLGPGGFFGNHQMGEIGEQARQRMDALWDRIAAEPDPTLEQTKEDVRLEFPRVSEAPRESRPTHIIINGAIRAALRDIIQANPMTWINGQDTAVKGGVMQATAGLWEEFPGNVTDAPINEPAIMSSALGFALHKGAIAFPEIQFGDYALSGYHWMVYAGNLLWRSGGTRQINWNLRLPVEPGIYGAVYHSTPLEGLMASIPGLTIVSFSTSRDAYGLIRSAAEYAGPVVIFEPKALYRSALGDAFPGEARLNPKEAADFEKWISNYRGIPDIPKDFRVPLGKAAVRREGRDLSIVTWGLAHAETQKVMDKMIGRGIDVELIDLRTLVPPDMETVRASVAKTGRLLVVHQDRVFASLGREIQGQIHDAFPDRPIVTKVLGMEPVPGIPQNKAMEDAVKVTGDKILAEASRLMGLME